MTRLRKKLGNLAIAIKTRNINDAHKYAKNTILILAVITNNSTIAGIIIFGDFIQTLTITRIAYKITKNKYGHEVYANI